MKRSTLLFSLALAAAILLSACTITVEPGPPPPRQPDATVTAGNNDATPVQNFAIPAGRDVLVRVNVDSTRPVLYLELNRNIDLEVFNSSRTRIASASSSAYFGTGTTGLTTASLLEPQAITTSIACRGSCVILDQGTSSHYFVLITNTSGASINVDLFVFGDTMQDDNEPANDVVATAPYLNVNTTEAGAIEVLGDIDYWRVNQEAQLLFEAPDALGLVLSVMSGDQVIESATDGQTVTALPGEYIRVRSEQGRAGASQASSYYISPAN